MRLSMRRQIGLLERSDAALGQKGLGEPSTVQKIPPEFSPHQYLVLLLHVAAEIEHALMVQYLYAAYSLGGTDRNRTEVARWQETIFGIAKEEMGHLMTAQNLLRCIGGPLNFDREDYPWDSDFYPFPFLLEPLTRRSLARYIVAESPANWQGAEADEIRGLASEGVPDRMLHRIGALYQRIADLLKDSSAIRDADFREVTFPFQANWDEWGRGYERGARGAALGTAIPATPHVLLIQIANRTMALEAVLAIAAQGEAATSASDETPSHFARFLRIYREFPRDDSWKPTRNVPVNPTVSAQNPAYDESDQGMTSITHPQTKLWGSLFNVRYRMLLSYLAHSFDFAGNLKEGSADTARGQLVNAAFGEMYNLRAISGILVQMPLNADDDSKMAGPPFQMPFTTRLPHEQLDRWRLHLDLLEASGALCNRLLESKSTFAAYVKTLIDIDQHVHQRVLVVINQLAASAV